MPSVAFSAFNLQSIRFRVVTMLAAVPALLLPGAMPAQVTFTGAPTVVATGFNQPTGIAVDGHGNVYAIVFGGNQQLKETLNADGTYTQSTLATGLSFPWGVAVDASGDVFIPNTNSNSVIELVPSGSSYTQSTLTLNAGVSTTGIAVDASGNLYVTSQGNNAVYLETPTGGGAYTKSTIVSGLTPSGPFGVAVDALGNVYIADTGDNQLLMETPAGGGTWTQTTIGTGLSKPAGVVVDSQGNVYIADSGNNRILKETLNAGSYTQSTLGSGFSNPQGLALDANGNLYVGNDGGGTFLELHLSNLSFGSVAVNSTGATHTLNFSIASGTTVGSVGILTAGVTGKDFADAGSSTCTAQTYSSATNCTVNVSFSPLAAGLRSGAVVLYDGSGNALATVPVYGTGTGPQIAYNPGAQASVGSGFTTPDAVAVDGAGNTYIADSGTQSVVKVAPGGAQTTVGSGFTAPSGVAVDGAGNTYIADSSAGTVSMVTPNGTQTQVISALGSPHGIALDGAGNLYVASSAPAAVYKITPGGSQTTIGSGFAGPAAVAVDAAGDVFVGDINSGSSTGTVYEISAGGAQTSLGSGFISPSGIAVDAAGNIYVSDKSTTKVFAISPSGVQTTFASGFTAPSAVAVDAAGNVTVADSGAKAVTAINRATPPSLGFLNTTVSFTSTDSPRTVQVANIGTDTLTLSALSYPADFPEATGDSIACTATSSVLAGGACDLPIDFTPQSAGPLTESVQLTDNNLNASSAHQSVGVSGTAQAQTVTHFSVTGPSPVTTHGQFSITVTALDASNHTVAAYAGTVHFTTSDPAATLPANSTLSSGTGTFPVTLDTVGSQTVTATDTVNSGLSNAGNFTVIPAAATHFVVSAPSTANVGKAITFTVSAMDAFSDVATGYTGTVNFSSSDPSAVLPASTQMTNGTGSFPATLVTTGSQSITATDSVNSTINGSSNSIAVTIPILVVTTTVDDGGSASNCTVQTTPGVGTDNACSLRDALQYAQLNGSANISFSSSIFSAANTVAQNTITLVQGALTLPSYASVTGPTTGSGATLTNLVTISGANAFNIFYIDSTFTGASLTSLNLTGGAANYGAGVLNNGMLTITGSRIFGNAATATAGTFTPAAGVLNTGTLHLVNSAVIGNTSTASGSGSGVEAAGVANLGTMFIAGSTIANNMASANGGGVSQGGGVYNDGTLSIVNSTISGNSSLAGGAGLGGGIYSIGSLTITNSTVTNNNADQAGGLYVYSGTATGANTIISGDTAASNPEMFTQLGSFIDNGGNQIGVSGIDLAPLANYGGALQTQLPLPGSPAICGGLLANASGISNDERGLPRTASYNSTMCVDSGAVQSNYAIGFTTNPPASIAVGQPISPAPIVAVTESGVPAVATSSIAMTDSASLLGGTDSASLSSGSATFSNLLVTAQTSNDTLTATLTLNSSLKITAASTQFNATKTTPTITWNTPAPITYGTALSGTQLNASTTVAGSFAYTPAANTVLTAGTQTLSVTFTPTDTTDYNSATTTVQLVVNQATPTITWANPAPILAGTALSGTQLNATASTAGSFVYTPAAGTMLAPGPQTLSVLFTPTDTTDFTTATASVSLTVGQTAAITSPVQGSTLSGSSVAFTWSTGSGASDYELWLGTTGIGSSDLYHGTPTTGLTYTASNIPTNGVLVYARIWTLVNGGWHAVDYQYTEFGSPTPASMTTPVPNSKLTGSSVTFQWNGGAGPTAYSLWVGTTGPGSQDLFNSGQLTTTQAAVSGIPTNGVAIYVRLWWKVNGAWQSADYTYTEFGSPTPASMSTPAPNSTLTGSSATFQWNGGAGPTAYSLWVGTTGPGSQDLFNSGQLTTTQAAVSGIPTNGVALYVRLWWKVNGGWQSADYTYTEFGTPTPASLTTPTPNTTLGGGNTTFQWNGGAGPVAYELWVGTGGIGSQNIFNSGQITATQAAVNVPANGVALNVRLWWKVNGAWQSADYAYMESGSPTPASMSSPSPGTTLGSGSINFQWNGGAGPSSYELWVGTDGIGSQNIFNSGQITATQAAVNVPANGVTLNVRLWWKVNGAWQSADYTYMESGSPTPASMASPAPGATLTGPSATFQWNGGAGPSSYELWVGTTGVGSQDVLNSGVTTAKQATVTVPTNGVTLYVRLWWKVNGAWQSADYTYTEFGTPSRATLTSPTTGAHLPSSQLFQWNTGAGVTGYDLWIGTTGVGSQDVFNSGPINATSANVTGIPTNGETVYVTVWSKISGVWQPVSYTFQAFSN